jgi:hypothetical protein
MSLIDPSIQGLSCYFTMLSVSKLYSVDDVVIDEYGAAGGVKIGRGNRSSRRKPASVPFCPPQIPYVLTWDTSL